MTTNILQDRNELIGQQIKVYYNLKKNCLSIKYKNKVKAYGSILVLEKCQFKVSEAGRQRVLRTGHKNVHAYICGILVSYEIAPNNEKEELNLFRVKYNPYKYSSFVNFDTESPIAKADRVEIIGKSILAIENTNQ